jgi:hypothetical protein
MAGIYILADIPAFDEDDQVEVGKKVFGEKGMERAGVATPRVSGHMRDAMIRKKIASPQFDYEFRVEMPNVGMRGGTNADINHRILSIDAPLYQFDTKRRIVGNKLWHIAGQYEVGQISFKIDEYEDGLSLSYLNDWMQLIRSSKNGLFNAPATYKRDVKIIRLSSTDFDLHYSVYKGCFPHTVAPINFSYEGEGILTYHVSLTVDDVDHYMVPASVVKTWTNGAQGLFKGAGITGFGQLAAGGIGDQIFDTVGKYVSDAVTSMSNAVKTGYASGYDSFDENDTISGLSY